MSAQIQPTVTATVAGNQRIHEPEGGLEKRELYAAMILSSVIDERIMVLQVGDAAYRQRIACLACQLADSLDAELCSGA